MEDISGGLRSMNLRGDTSDNADWYIIAHGKKTQLYQFTPRNAATQSNDECTLIWEEVDISHCCPTHGGDRICINRKGSNILEIIDLFSRKIVSTIQLPPDCVISGILFSTKDTYLVVHTAWSEANPNNLVIYRINGPDVTPVLAIPYSKSYTVKRYPIWTPCETYCTIRVNNDLFVFKDGQYSLETPLSKISLTFGDDGAVPFSANSIISISPVTKNGACYLAAFTPEQKGTSGLVRIYNLQDATKPCYENVFKYAEEGEFFWSTRGTTAVLRTFINNVKGLSSYYGGNGLFLLQPHKANHETIMEPTEGQAHEVSWSRTANDILIIKGTRPAELDMYDGNSGNKILTFGRHHRNTIRRDAFDRLVLIGGFGNLSGDIDIWDLKKRCKIAQTKSDCAVFCDFAPDGRYFVTATTCPRMRVNNCFKVFSYSGKLVSQIDFDELYHLYICSPGRTFVARDPSPTACTVAPTVKKSVYRAPGSRPDGPTAAAFLRLEAQTTVATPVARPPVSIPRGPPGADPTLLAQAARISRKKKDQANKRNN
ncbi:Eukaryotic translation initiation factor eIF2A family protein [Babesia bovis T2Bo]|uniref:Eukaryotic translation initiation factor 2A n=1 Tax=Babesia bovis TaxID=5865 RepID=A7AS25_BABBO|nr:Eukaryotic translation initiation factor eIF2A family protein [Babesia bovis T2Bo]EDO07344.1 Eukaryotic translation initiation factor eIF2A family protein [Babesia bovis T2Bo]|eukprot:XP_001610912.1 hypothetical protein [Babesia bovis T2Bo]